MCKVIAIQFLVRATVPDAFTIRSKVMWLTAE